MEEVYTARPSSTHPERRGVSRKTVIDEAKEKIPVIELADLLCGPGKMRKVGERWVARCPIPGHDERTHRSPSIPKRTHGTASGRASVAATWSI